MITWAYLGGGGGGGGIAPMGSAEIEPQSKHMTPKKVTAITSAKKIMIMQLIAANYYYS